MARKLAEKYRAPFIDRPDPLLRKCFIGATTVAVLVLIVVFLAPLRDTDITSVEEMPERLAKLIIEKPKPGDDGPKADAVSVDEPTPDVAEPEPEPEPVAKVVAPKPRTRSRREEPKPDVGKEGRERAKKEITEKLVKTTTKVETALKDLTAALETSTNGDDKPKPKRRRSRVRKGRGSSDITPVEVAMRTTGEAADVGGTTVAVDLVALDGIAALDGGGSGDGGANGSADGTGAAPGVYRSTASLSAIIRKYAAGIQYCYENELKHNPTLEGKIIVVISVAANGDVSSASIAHDTVASDSVQECVLTQIRAWKFPPIAEGSTSFQAPFVFTPPRN